MEAPGGRRASRYVFSLLAMLATVMGFHLVLLQTGLNECDAYQRILLERLKAADLGGEEAIAIRKELADYLSGKTTECGEAEEVYSQAADKYLAVIISLMTGAGVVAGVNRGVQLKENKQDDDPKPSP